MKILILSFLVCIQNPSFSQNTERDSLNMASEKLDSVLLNFISGYEEKGTDFLLLRISDTVGLKQNSFRIVYRVDSTCTSKFGRYVDKNGAIHYVGIGDVDYDIEGNAMPCKDELAELEMWMRELEEGVVAQKQDAIDFNSAKYTFYGKLGENYLFEQFNEEFIATFHSGFLYDTVCFVMGARCSY